MRLLTAITFTLLSLSTVAQVDLSNVHPDGEYENIHVKKMDSDSLQTSFVIWVKRSVKMHYHATHTESIYVLEGEGTMVLGDKTINLKPGDYVNIPMGAHHNVNVTSDIPMKVLSVQAPEFKGKDRVYVD